MAAPPQARPNVAQHAERDAKIFRLKIAGLTERAIAAEVGLSQPRVHEIIAEAIRDLVEPEVEELRKIAAARLDDQRRTAYAVRSRPHYVVQGGKIVNGPDGRPLIDDGPVLAANEQLRKIDEREARLYGLDPKEPLEIRLDAQADVTVAAISAVIDRLQLPPDRKAFALEAAAAAIEGAPLPEPPPAEGQERDTQRVPWPVLIEGREHVWDARRKCYREMGPEYRPGEGGEIILDAELVDAPEAADEDGSGSGVPDDEPEAVRLALEAGRAALREFDDAQER